MTGAIAKISPILKEQGDTVLTAALLQSCVDLKDLHSTFFFFFI